MHIYCFKCKRYTENKSVNISRTSNGKEMLST